jgi:hypothetical protein
VKWLGILGRRPIAPAPAPKITDLLPADLPSDREVRLVRDMAGHVTSKVTPIVAMHGGSMESTLQANVMALEVALRLGLEATLRTALTVLTQGGTLEEAQAKIDDALAILAEGLADHRPELMVTIEAAAAGIAGGQVRQ